MKRLFTLLMGSLAACCVMAVPAKRGVWRLLTLADGTQVEALLTGDECLHYWQTADGQQLVEGPDDGLAVAADMGRLRSKARNRASLEQRCRQQHRAHLGRHNGFRGSKRGLVILVEFANQTFQAGHDSLLYTRICNEQGFTSDEGFRGSVHDYFLDQSYGVFDLTFDVCGPVVMPENYQYYGTDLKESGDDAHAGEMVAMACQAIADNVNFADYDWDGDDEVDQVLCVYAGRGQADGGTSSTIWPHEWVLAESDYGHKLELQGVTIDTYAVVNERSSRGIAGIGTICHEFAHCLGLPDMYDTESSGCYGLNDWSLMDQGNYNGNSFCPAGLTSFERYSCGWLKPTELGSADTLIVAIPPLSQQPEAYIVRNDAWTDEYFMIENRQQQGWDSKLPGRGLLVLHVDFDSIIWENNIVNAIVKAGNADSLPPNNHQRCALLRASESWGLYSSTYDAYPYQGNDSITNTSMPAAKLYHPSSDGTFLLNRGILGITPNAGGTISFRYRATATELTETPNAEGIQVVGASPVSPHGAFTLSGQPVAVPRKGVYIETGRKRLGR